MLMEIHSQTNFCCKAYVADTGNAKIAYTTLVHLLHTRGVSYCNFVPVTVLGQYVKE